MGVGGVGDYSSFAGCCWGGGEMMEHGADQDLAEIFFPPEATDEEFQNFEEQQREFMGNECDD